MIKVSVNRLSTIISLTHSAINRLHCHFLPKRMYMSALLRKNQMTRQLPHPTNECQRSINDIRQCIMKHPVGCAITVGHNRTIGSLSMAQWWEQHIYYVLKMSVKRASMTFDLASWKMHGLCGNVTLSSRNRPPFWAKTLATTSLLCPQNERQRSVNDFWPWIMENPSAVRRH